MNVGVTSHVCESLNRGSRTQTEAGNRRQLRVDERAERIDQLILVLDVTTVDGVLVVDPVVDAQEIFAIVQRVRLLEGDVVADRTVDKRSREADAVR